MVRFGAEAEVVTVREIFYLGNMLCWLDRLQSVRSGPSNEKIAQRAPSRFNEIPVKIVLDDITSLN